MENGFSQVLAVWYSLEHWWGYVNRALTVVAIAVILRWVGHRLVRRFFRSVMRTQLAVMSERRARTLEGLLTSLVTFIISVTAIVSGMILLGAPGDTLVLALGLFSAGFGLGARPLVSDYLAGITLLFEYSYAFGEKVEILNVVGTVERVELRTTEIRADTGELFIVPNGDVRLIRNFSRGAFSPATVRVTVAAGNLERTIEVLEGVAEAAVARYGEDLIDRPDVISETGELGATTQLTLLARARYAQGAALRRQLLADVHVALREAEIEVA